MRDARNERPVGRVVGLWRYPVKSMGGEALREADVGWHGLAGDRRWAFVRGSVAHSGFPWFTLRQRNDLNRYRPFFAEPARPDKSKTLVRAPSGDTFEVADPALAAELYREQVRLIKQDRGNFDTFPLSLISTQTIGWLGDRIGATLDAQRFRPNILVESIDGAPFAEEEWLGKVLRIGGMRMRIDKRDSRCVVITIDPATGERNPAILRAVAEHREGRLGVYGTTVEPSRIAVDNAVMIEMRG
jgi:uncharacterized protein YcbX